MQSKNFILTDETKINIFGVKLYRIKCIKTFIHANEGDLGGWVSGNANVSGNAWVSGDAEVFGNAKVFGNAWVYGNANVSGNAWVSGDAKVFGNAKVFGDAKVYGNAWVCGDAWVSGDAEVFGNAKVYGDEKITYKVIHIVSDVWSITFGNKIAIGCKRYSIEEWKNFNNDIINSFDAKALSFWINWKDIIFATWDIHSKLNLKNRR